MPACEQRGQAKAFRNLGLTTRTDLRRHLKLRAEPARSRTAARSGSVRLGWALVKLLATRLLPVRRSPSGAATATATALFRVAALTLTLTLTLIRIASTGLSGLSRLGSAFAVPRGEHDLEFDQFIPLCIRALPLGDSQQCLHSLARRNWLLFAHGCIVSSIGNFGIRMLTRPGAPKRGKSTRVVRTQSIRLNESRHDEEGGTQRDLARISPAP